MPFWLKPTWCAFLPSWICFVFHRGAFTKMAAMAFLRRFRYTGATLGAVASQKDRYTVRCMDRHDGGGDSLSDIPEEDLFGSPLRLSPPRSPSVVSSGFAKSTTTPKDRASPLGRPPPLDRLVENRRLIGLLLGSSPQADGPASSARQMASPPQLALTDLVAYACARRCIFGSTDWSLTADG